MNRFLKVFLCLVIGLGFAATTIPVSKTKWSDNIRAEVAAHRLARRQKMEAEQRQREGQPNKDEKKSEKAPHINPSAEKTHAESAHPKEAGGKDEGMKENHNRPHVPKPKPAELSWKAAAEIPVFLLQCGIPFLAAAFTVLAFRKRRRSKSET